MGLNIKHQIVFVNMFFVFYLKDLKMVKKNGKDLVYRPHVYISFFLMHLFNNGFDKGMKRAIKLKYLYSPLNIRQI